LSILDRLPFNKNIFPEDPLGGEITERKKGKQRKGRTGKGGKRSTRDCRGKKTGMEGVKDKVMAFTTASLFHCVPVVAAPVSLPVFIIIAIILHVLKWLFKDGLSRKLQYHRGATQKTSNNEKTSK